MPARILIDAARLTASHPALNLNLFAEWVGRSLRSDVGAGEESPDSNGQCAG